MPITEAFNSNEMQIGRTMKPWPDRDASWWQSKPVPPGLRRWCRSIRRWFRCAARFRLATWPGSALASPARPLPKVRRRQRHMWRLPQPPGALIGKSTPRGRHPPSNLFPRSGKKSKTFTSWLWVTRLRLNELSNFENSFEKNRTMEIKISKNWK